MRGLSAEQRRKIVHKWCTEPGLSLRKLAKIEGVSEKAVRTAIRKFSEDNSFEDKPKTGRKKVLPVLVWINV
jgi:transposase